MKKSTKIILISLTVLFSILSASITISAAYLYKYKDNKVDKSLLELNINSGDTEFFAYSSSDRSERRGKAYKIKGAHLENGVKYQYVALNEIPDNLINAYIAVEDKRFYSHFGIDIPRTSFAAINYIFGKGGFGGSTITQQLVKNLTGNSEISVKRKISEAFSSINLEREFDKTEILEMYLNIINLAAGCQGVGAASEYYFSKSPMELTLSECAIIAAITNNPSKYNPQSHPENNLLRRNIILKRMLEQGYITQEEYISAKDEPILLHISENHKNNTINSWYIDMVTEDVINDLSEKYGIDKKNASQIIYKGGLNIYTAMDDKIQSILEKYYENIYNFPIDSQGKMPNSSMIIVDPYNGDILGVAGNIGKKSGNRIQNFATNTKRPTGSAIKPLSVYAPALDLGIIDWATIIEDSPVTFDKNGVNPWPKNASNTYIGNVNIKYAIENSLNTIAVKVLMNLGEEKSFDFLTKKLLMKNLNHKSDRGHASLALGQQSIGLTLRELTAAYSIFIDGFMCKPRSYFKVTDKNGVIILDNSYYKERAISTESAAIMTKLLQSVTESGTAKEGITLDNILETAGKSGTTQNSCDRYFVGYTPELLGGTWFGYEYPKSLEEFGGNMAVYIWDDVMNEIYKSTEYGKKTNFAIPDTVQKLTFNTETGRISDFDGDIYDLDEGWFVIPHNED